MPILSAFGAARTIPGSGVVEGENSYDFNGSSYFSYPTSSSFAIGSSNFSIECFVYLDSYPASKSPILDFGYGTGSSSGSTFQFYIDSAGCPVAVRNNYPTSPSSTAVTSSVSVSLSTWTYIAVSRSSSTTRVFVGSSQTGSSPLITSISSGGKIPRIGSGSVQTSFFLDGKISNLRFNIGSGFSSATVPTSPLTAQATTKMLTCQSSTVKDNSVANGGGPWTVTNSGVIVSTSSPF